MTELRPLGARDVPWAVEVLARRRAALRPDAPRYWRPAPDAVERHAAHLTRVLGGGEGHGYRSERGLMVAVPAADGWTVDDAWVPPDAWPTEGLDLWIATTAHLDGSPVCLVCPVAEPERARFAVETGLVRTSSWWHSEVTPRATASEVLPGPRMPGALAVLVDAPPVYDPGGPVTFVRRVTEVSVPARAREFARSHGSPLVVVEQPAVDDALRDALLADGYVRHCDFFTGTAVG